ncbi:MAG: hypothetical protein RDV48_07235 [Candidatus Eremiobacteraeota bacterium]|nr:hypothetical protein [Candidatus Eremiobacteraeota bacterium]
MAKKLKISRTFKECYQKLPREIRKKVDKHLRFLRENPIHPSLRLHLIERTGSIWEGYVDASYRFTFEIREDHYYLRAVGAHKIIDIEARRG